MSAYPAISLAFLASEARHNLMVAILTGTDDSGLGNALVLILFRRTVPALRALGLFACCSIFFLPPGESAFSPARAEFPCSGIIFDKFNVSC